MPAASRVIVVGLLFASVMVYDVRNRLTSSTNPIGDMETVTLDENSNPTKMVDFKGKITLYQYDKLNRLTKVIRKIADTADTEDADDIVSTITYDPEANILSTTDALGRKTYLKYDQLNRTTQVNRKVGDTLDEINADDSVTKFSYDLANNIVSIIDPSNKFVYRDYDLLDRLIKVIQKIGDTANTEDVDDIVTTFEYDGVHNNIKIVDGNGKVTYRKFDNLDRLTKVVRKVTDTDDIIDADDAVTTMVYDDVDNLLSVNKPNNITISQTFDKLNRIETRTNGAGETDSVEYDPVGNVLKVIRANGNIINMVFDALDRMISTTDSEGLVVTKTYDPTNNLLTETDGNNNTITNKYDDIHRLEETIDALGKSSFVTYDKVNNITQIKDRNNNITTRTFDDLNRLLTNKDALNFTTTYTYNESSDLLSITDTLNQTTTYTYDDIHRLTTTTYADSTTVQLSYDKVHNIVNRIDQNSANTGYAYSDLYFLTQRTYPVDAPDVFAHDKDGRILVASKADWTCAYNYDGADRVTQEVSNGKALSKTYNIPARTFTCQFPQGRTLTKTRDKRDRLISIQDTDNSTIAQYGYDPGDRMVSCTTENGITRTNTFDKNDNFTSIEHRKVSDNSLIAGFTYTRDDEENILTIEDLVAPNFSQKLSLDSVYRIVNFKQGQLNAGDIANPGREISFDLDGVGNHNSKTTDGIVEDRTHNNVNEIASIDGVPFIHDDNGNLKDDGQKLYKYDTENRLIEVARKSDGRVLVQFQYDAMGRRVRKKIFDPNTGILSKQVEFYCNKETVIEEYEKDADAGGNLGAERLVRQFVDGDNIDEHILQDIYDVLGNISQSLYYCTNHQGNTSVITDNAGVVLFRFKYDPYGKAFKLNGNQLDEFTDHALIIWSFQGRRNDQETGLMYFRARYYSTSLGRFLQRDLVGYKDSMNMYESFGSNTHIYGDAFGLNVVFGPPKKYKKYLKTLREKIKKKYGKFILKGQMSWQQAAVNYLRSTLSSYFKDYILQQKKPLRFYWKKTNRNPCRPASCAMLYLLSNYVPNFNVAPMNKLAKPANKPPLKLPIFMVGDVRHATNAVFIGEKMEEKEMAKKENWAFISLECFNRSGEYYFVVKNTPVGIFSENFEIYLPKKVTDSGELFISDDLANNERYVDAGGDKLRDVVTGQIITKITTRENGEFVYTYTVKDNTGQSKPININRKETLDRNHYYFYATFAQSSSNATSIRVGK